MVYSESAESADPDRTIDFDQKSIGSTTESLNLQKLNAGLTTAEYAAIQAQTNEVPRHTEELIDPESSTSHLTPPLRSEIMDTEDDETDSETELSGGESQLSAEWTGLA